MLISFSIFSFRPLNFAAIFQTRILFFTGLSILFAYLSQNFYYFSMKSSGASTASSMRYSFVIFTPIVESIFYFKIPVINNFFGPLIIVIGIILIAKDKASFKSFSLPLKARFLAY